MFSNEVRRLEGLRNELTRVNKGQEMLQNLGRRLAEDDDGVFDVDGVADVAVDVEHRRQNIAGRHLKHLIEKMKSMKRKRWIPTSTFFANSVHIQLVSPKAAQLSISC